MRPQIQDMRERVKSRIRAALRTLDRAKEEAGELTALRLRFCDELDTDEHQDLRELCDWADQLVSFARPRREPDLRAFAGVRVRPTPPEGGEAT